MEPTTTPSPRDRRRTRLTPHPAAQTAPSLHPPRDPQSTRLYLQDREGTWPLLGPAAGTPTRHPGARCPSQPQQPSPLPCGSAVEAHPPSSPLARAPGVSLPARPQPSLLAGGGRSVTGLCALCLGLQERRGGRLASWGTVSLLGQAGRSCQSAQDTGCGTLAWRSALPLWLSYL